VFRGERPQISANLVPVTLHDELRELAATYGNGLFLDAEQFRAALDDFVEEGSALPGQVNLLYDAVRLGGYIRCLSLLEQNSEPAMAVQTAGDALARDRGTLETASAQWAVATLAAATGHLDRAVLEQFLGPRPADQATLTEPEPLQTMDIPTPAAPPPTAPPPSAPPPTAAPPTAPPPTAAPPTAPPPTAAPPPAPPPTAGVPSPSPAPPSVTEQPPTPATAMSPAVDLSTARAPSPPPPTPPVPDRPAGRRRGPLIAVGAVGAVLLLAAGGFATKAALDDPESGDPDAKDGPSGSPSSSSSSSASSSGTEPPPLVAPGKPTITAKSAYRKVVFNASVRSESEDVVYELRTPGGWTATDATFPIETAKGGQQRCAVVRAVAVDDAGSRSEGPSRRECGTSQDPVIEWVASKDACPPADQVSGFTCRQYDLVLKGFGSNQEISVETVSTTYQGSVVPCPGDCVDQVQVDADGRLHETNFAYAYGGQDLALKVAGKPTVIHVPS
jgi:hypothetical protein